MVAQKFHFAILQIEVTRASCGLSAIAELLVYCCDGNYLQTNLLTYCHHICNSALYHHHTLSRRVHL